MKTIIVFLIFGVLLVSCSNSNGTKTVTGEWNVIKIMPKDSVVSPGGVAAFAWLNIFLGKKSLTFRNDSLFVEGKYYSNFRTFNNSIEFLGLKNKDVKFDILYSSDTLILINHKDKTKLFLKKKNSP